LEICTVDFHISTENQCTIYNVTKYITVILTQLRSLDYSNYYMGIYYRKKEVYFVNFFKKQESTAKRIIPTLFFVEIQICISNQSIVLIDRVQTVKSMS